MAASQPSLVVAATPGCIMHPPHPRSVAPPPPPSQDIGCFRGSVLHCHDLSSVQVVEGKRVVVVGTGKVAIDTSYEIASQGKATSVTVVYRQVGQALPPSPGQRPGLKGNKNKGK